MADDSVQPEPWVFLVAMRGAGKPQHFAGLEEKIDAFRAAAMAAFDEHRTGPQAEQLLRLRAHLVFVAGRRGIEQHRGLRQIGRHHARACDQFAQPAERIAAQQSSCRSVAIMTGSSTTLRGW